jgi:hypothetical protein
MLYGVTSFNVLKEQGFLPGNGVSYWCPHYGVHDEVKKADNKGNIVVITCDTVGKLKCIFYGLRCTDCEEPDMSKVDGL